EQGGGDEVASGQFRGQVGALAADDDAGSLGAAGGDVALDALLLAPADHGADHRGGGERVGEPLGGGGLGERVDELVPAGAGHQQPGLGDAGLAVDHERHRQQGGDDLVDVGVVEDDRGGLAAQFQGDAGDAGGAGGHDLLARGGAAGEGDLVDSGVVDEVGALLPVGGDDVEHALGQARLTQGVGEVVGRQRRLGRRLEDDRASRGERGGDLEGGGAQRPVPG